MNKWWTVTLIVETISSDGIHCDGWDHPFNYDTAKEAWDAAVHYYSEMPEVQVSDIRPSTKQEVIEFLTECYGHYDDDLPF